MATVLSPPQAAQGRVVLHNMVSEVDITRSSINKLSIFAEIRVPEIWRYDGEQMEILVLRGDAYQRSEASSVLPTITATILTGLVSASLTLNRLEWMKKVREWVRAGE